MNIQRLGLPSILRCASVFPVNSSNLPVHWYRAMSLKLTFEIVSQDWCPIVVMLISALWLKVVPPLVQDTPTISWLNTQTNWAIPRKGTVTFDNGLATSWTDLFIIIMSLLLLTYIHWQWVWKKPLLLLLLLPGKLYKCSLLC